MPTENDIPGRFVYEVTVPNHATTEERREILRAARSSFGRDIFNVVPYNRLHTVRLRERRHDGDYPPFHRPDTVIYILTADIGRVEERCNLDYRDFADLGPPDPPTLWERIKGLFR